MNNSGTPLLNSHIYYFKIGNGKWEGDFSFEITDKKEFKKDSIGIKNRFLVNAMIFFQKLFGKSKISSEIKIYPGENEAGVARNVVRIHKIGITLYLVKEEYILSSNGTNVKVVAKDRFGPIPFLFTQSKDYPAMIHKDGLSSTYYMPLLGTQWICEYLVQNDMKNIRGTITCKWAVSSEIIHKIN